MKRIAVSLCALVLAACGGSAAPASSSSAAAAKPSSPAPAASAPASAAAKPAASSTAASAKPAASTAASAKPAASAAASAKPSAGGPVIRSMELVPSPEPSLGFGQMVQELGLFQKHGLNVNVMHAGGGGPQKVQILVSGSADIIMTDIISMYSGQYEGADITAFFAPIARFGVPLVAQNNITKVEQLKGQQVGVPSLAGAARFLLIMAFDHFGVKDQDVKWLAIPDAPQALPALVAGRVTASYISTATIPLVSEPPAKDKVHLLIDTTARYTPPWPNFEFVAKKSWLQQNADAAERYVEALLDFERMISKDQKLYASVAHKIFPRLSEEQAAGLWTLLTDNGYWADNGGINFTGTQTALDAYFKAKNLSPNGHLSKSSDGFTTGPLKAALDKMGLASGSKDTPDWYKK